MPQQRPPTSIDPERQLLVAWGWSAERETEFLALPDADALAPGRVVCQEKTWLQVQTTHFRERAKASGRLRHQLPHLVDLPVVGDWVLIPRTAKADERWPIESVMRRGPTLARRDAGPSRHAQILASNVDEGLIVAGLDQEPNLQWIERAVALVVGGGMRPTIVLNKADAHADCFAYVEGVRTHFSSVPVHAVSAHTGAGLDGVDALKRTGTTAVMLGPSGAGKSSLLNALMGEGTAATGAVRATDAKGRHTTTHRELFALPNGILLVDVPGVRELGLLPTVDADPDAFNDVALVAEGCQFRDCQHKIEPGCAVQHALHAGAFEREHVQGYLTLEAIRRGEASVRPPRRRRAAFRRT